MLIIGSQWIRTAEQAAASGSRSIATSTATERCRGQVRLTLVPSGRPRLSEPHVPRCWSRWPAHTVVRTATLMPNDPQWSFRLPRYTGSRHLLREQAGAGCTSWQSHEQQSTMSAVWELPGRRDRGCSPARRVSTILDVENVYCNREEHSRGRAWNRLFGAP